MLQKHRIFISLILYITVFWHNIQPQVLDQLYPNTCSKNNKLYFFAKYYEKKYRDTDTYLKDIGTQTTNDIITNIQAVENSFEENNDNISVDTQSHFSFHEEFKNFDNKIAYSTPCTVKNPLSILDTLEQKNIDRYYEKIDRGNCHFLHHAETQTILKEGNELPVKQDKIVGDKPKRIKYSFNCKKGCKTPKKIKKYKVFIVEIPAKSKRRNKKQGTFHKSTVLGVKETKVIKPQKLNFVDGDSSPSSVDQKTNFSTNTGGYIYDTFIGNYENDTLYNNEIKMGFVKPADNIMDSLNININQSLDMYKRITKYGWTYTKSNSSLNNSPREVDPYKICFDNDELSNNSWSPLTVGEKKNNSVLGSLRKMKSKFMFWKDTSPMKMKKSVSYEEVSPSVKYQKISKFSTCKSI